MLKFALIVLLVLVGVLNWLLKGLSKIRRDMLVGTFLGNRDLKRIAGKIVVEHENSEKGIPVFGV